MSSRLLSTAASLGLALSMASGASAQTTPTKGAAPTAQAAAPFAAEKAASIAALGQATTREDMSLVSNSQQSSTVSGNSVNGTSTTGDISFSDSAFQNASGLTVINANSGNNVSMNASMNVNIVMVPAAAPQQ